MMSASQKVIYGFSYGAFRAEPRHHTTCLSDGKELAHGLI